MIWTLIVDMNELVIVGETNTFDVCEKWFCEVVEIECGGECFAHVCDECER